MERVYNFSPGPSMLAQPVLEKAQKDLMVYGNTGMSVMEMSHRSKMYTDIFDKTVADLRALMHIGDDYEVLLLQGGATLQFSAIPLNLMVKGKADYVDSGNFAHLAAEEAKRYGEVNIAATSRADNYTYVPDMAAAKFDPDADYVHITQNNTIYGTRFVELPGCQSAPCCRRKLHDSLRTDGCEPLRVVYAGAQKNIGPSGLCVVIVRKDLLGYAKPICPKLMDWKVEADKGSMYNTPNTWGIYLAGLTFDWLLSIGGVEAIYQVNQEKAKLLYDFLDNSKLFKATAQKKYRSLMNVTFDDGRRGEGRGVCEGGGGTGIGEFEGPSDGGRYESVDL